MPKDGKNWSDSGTLPDMPPVGYVEIPQVWPGFDNDPEHEYPVGCDIMGHGRVVQRVVQRPAEQRGRAAAATNINRSGVVAARDRGGTTRSNGRATGVRDTWQVDDSWIETSESEDEWGEE